MSEKIRVATVQPPVPDGKNGVAQCIRRGFELADQAAKAGARIVCLPEYFGVFGLPDQEGRDRIRRGDEVLTQWCAWARRDHVAVLYPSLEWENDALFNTTWIIGADGQLSGRYRKVHLTANERTDKGCSAGDTFPVFSVSGLRFGVMTCYDGYFSESARILALQKAQVIFWPTLQRGATQEVISLQVRSRALDNCVYVVRSSYGYPKDVAWKPGMMVGMSCIADWEGRVIADLGHDEGFLVAEIPAGKPRPRPRSFGGKPESPRDYLFEYRRPEVYGALCEG
ncbi:MAG: carbon-nitrogen hydrolase family protein [Candidatus Latescibacteria bacterium]|nr:carbon-nitrogen hydrolase family protein [Candidatus Latescibacterota bacterium]